MKLIYAALLFVLFNSCTDRNNKSPDSSKYNEIPSANVDDVIKKFHELRIDDFANYTHIASYKAITDRATELKKSIEIIEKDTTGNPDLLLVFYKYSAGTDIIRKAQWLKRLGGKWYIENQYFSRYDDDPFKDGNGQNAKKLIEKADKWEKESEHIWWNR